MTKTHPDDRARCMALWVANLVILYGTFVTFFEKRLIVESSYLLMLLLAIQLSLAYQLQYVSGGKFAALAYGFGSVLVVYFIIMNAEIQRLNF